MKSREISDKIYIACTEYRRRTKNIQLTLLKDQILDEICSEVGIQKKAVLRVLRTQ